MAMSRIEVGNVRERIGLELRYTLADRRAAEGAEVDALDSRIVALRRVHEALIDLEFLSPPP